MRKILYISGSRADYGLMNSALRCISKTPGLKVEIVVTGQHLMPEFGRTVSQINDGEFRIHRVRAVYEQDKRESTVDFIGRFTLSFPGKVKKIKPDFLLLLGDRAEMLAAAVVGSYLGIPVAHVHGGDISSSVDESVRHAITKLSHIHFAATLNSAERIIRLGEEPWRVHLSGAPGLDSILKCKLPSRDALSEKYGLVPGEPFLVLIQHAQSYEIKDAARQIQETMEVFKNMGIRTIAIYPNADAGGRKIIKALNKYRNCPFLCVYKNIPYNDYLGLLNSAGALVGNSSSGIIECASLGLPVVNIGTRQRGRERAENVLDADYDRKSISRAIKKALYDKDFRCKAANSSSPYGDGKAGSRIASVLSSIKINRKLLDKRITY